MKGIYQTMISYCKSNYCIIYARWLDRMFLVDAEAEKHLPKEAG